MMKHWSLRFAMALLLCLFLDDSISIQLQPIRPATDSGKGSVEKRGGAPALELQNAETFLWGSGLAQPILANLTVFTPGDSENIIAMEKFSGMLKSVACTNTSMTLVFNDKSGLQYAQSSWEWVNRADSHAFIMVAGSQDCRWNAYRPPFNVTNVVYNDVTNSASLTATPSDWQTIAHSYHLLVNHTPASESQIQARNSGRQGSIDFTHSIPSTPLSITTSDPAITLECVDCSSTGKIDWDLEFTKHFGITTDANLRFTPSSLGATATLKLTESGDLTKPLSTSVPVLSVPLDGVKIDKFVDIGLALDFSIGADLTSVKGSASITGGASLAIPDSSVLAVDLLDPSADTFSGWKPVVSSEHFSVDAQIEASLGIYVQSALKFARTIFEVGRGVELGLKLPNLEAELTVDASTNGACGTSAAFDVQANASIGAALFFAETDGTGQILKKHDLADLSFPIAETCLPVGPTQSASASGSSTSIVTSSVAPSSLLTTTSVSPTNTSASSTPATDANNAQSQSGLPSAVSPEPTPTGIVSTISIHPSSSPTPPAQSYGNGTMQYSPNVARRGEVDKVKLMAGLSRHLRNHQLGRR